MRNRPLIAAAALFLAAACAQPVSGAAETAPQPQELHYDAPQMSLPPRPAHVDNRPRFEGFTHSYDDQVTLAALAENGLSVYESPEATESFLVLPEKTIIGTTTVVTLVGEPTNGWAEVMLPIRPNGSTGWIRTDEVELFAVSGEIIVDISDRTLTYFQNGVEMLTTSVAVGASWSPTPLGKFYVTDSVTLTRPGTPWGPHALGLSARSDHVTEFNGGDGIIGIHGTSQPSSIGKSASWGCIRLHNEVITRLHDLVPVGTPVEIRA